MIRMMAGNPVILEQKKRTSPGCQDITKYFAPPSKPLENNIPSDSGNDFCDYFRNVEDPPNLTENVYVGNVCQQRPSHMNRQPGYEIMPSEIPARLYRNEPMMEDVLYQGLDLSCKGPSAEKRASYEAVSIPGPSLSEMSSSVSHLGSMDSCMSGMMHSGQQGLGMDVMSNVKAKTVNAFNMMLDSNRSRTDSSAVANGNKNISDLKDNFIPQHPKRKWESDPVSTFEEYDLKERSTTIPLSHVAPENLEVPRAEAKKRRRNDESFGPQGDSGMVSQEPMSQLQNCEIPEKPIEVISYEDFIKSKETSIEMIKPSNESATVEDKDTKESNKLPTEVKKKPEENENVGDSMKEKPVIEIKEIDSKVAVKDENNTASLPLPMNNVVESQELPVKKQSGIRRYFTRVPRTVEVKFDHKRVVTVKAVVHPRPQSPQKTTPKKVVNKRPLARKNLTNKQVSKTSETNDKHYNTRRRKSNVVVDTEELDLSIQELGSESTPRERTRKSWRTSKRKLSTNYNMDLANSVDEFEEEEIVMPNLRGNRQLGARRSKAFCSKNIQPDQRDSKIGRKGRTWLQHQKTEKRDVFDDYDHDDNAIPLQPRWSLRPRQDSTPGSRKSARLNPPKDDYSEVPEDAAVQDLEATPSRRPLRSIYKSTLVQQESAGGVLRLRFTRIGKKHHHRHHHHHHHYHRRHKKHKNAKVQKAMELLQRAKETTMLRHPAVVLDDSGLRRSTRQSSINVRKAMEGAARAEELRQARISAQRLETPRRRRKFRRMRSARRPKQLELSFNKLEASKIPQTQCGNEVIKNSSSCTELQTTKALEPVSVSQSAPVQLASIFQKHQSSSRKSGSAVPSSKVTSNVDQTERQKFLMSGVPETLLNRKGNANEEDLNFPLFPKIGHVQQKDSSSYIWNVDPPKQFLTKLDPESSLNLLNSTGCLKLGLIASLKSKDDDNRLPNQQFEDSRLPSNPLSKLEIKKGVSYINANNPKFPVLQIYRRYRAKYKSYERDAIKENSENLLEEDDDDALILDESDGSFKKKSECLQLDTDSISGISKELKGSCSSISWTEKYQPTHSIDVIGNTNNVMKIKSWLSEWKQRSIQKANRLKVSSKSNSGKGRTKKNKGYESEDSDFLISGDDDSSNEDSGLCNTLLLTGPSGIGKTATVYALAEELGYKVFEVNASSRRTGRQVLSQLQEATQSHQVAPAGKTLLTLFHCQYKADNNASKCSPSKNSKHRNLPRKTREKSEIPEKPICDKQQSSTSLILFEDIDLLFEEDDGLWQAINTLMATTKRPIVLTSTDLEKSFEPKIKRRYEEVALKIPRSTTIATYLQVLCLVENVPVKFEDILDLVEFWKGDIRKCMMELQYWVLSGGQKSGILQSLLSNTAILHPSVSSMPDRSPDSYRTNSQLPFSFTSEESQQESKIFESLKRVEIMQEDDSLGSFIERDNRIDSPYLELHQGSLISISGFNISSSLSLCEALQSTDLEYLRNLIHHCREMEISVTAENLPYLLPLSKVLLSKQEPSIPPNNFVKKSEKNCMDISWLSDENEEKDSLKLSKSEEKEAVKMKEDIELSADQKQLKREFFAEMLSTFSHLFDNLSVLDSMSSHVITERELNRSNCWKWWYREPMPGVSEEINVNKTNCEVFCQNTKDIFSSLEAQIVFQGQKELRNTVNKDKYQATCSQFNSEIAIPVTFNKETDIIYGEEFYNTRSLLQMKEDNGIVAEQFTSSALLNRHNLILDYLPCVREVCRCERWRQATNLKRGGRFLHYLDSSGISLPPAVLGRIGNEFSIV